MPDPTDRELVEWVARETGHHVGEFPPGDCGEWGHTGFWRLDNGYWDSVRFNPLARWADFGRVWEWAELESYEPGIRVMSNGEYEGSARVDTPGAQYVAAQDESNPRRALCLAILKAEGRIE